MEAEIDILFVNQKIAKHKRQIEIIETINKCIERLYKLYEYENSTGNDETPIQRLD